MIKALLKKQLSELGAIYFRNPKTGKRRSPAGVVGMTVLLLFVFVSFGSMFGLLGAEIAPIMISVGLDWFYFALIGLISVAIGVVGSVFTTYSALYQAKDNDLLLSLPVPPSVILPVRMVPVWIMGFAFESLVFLPGTVMYWVNAPLSAATVAAPLFLNLILSFVTLTLTCALGGLVAFIASRLKNKSAATVILTLLFLGAYYFVYFKMQDFLTTLLEHLTEVSTSIRGWGYPFYVLGQGCIGKILPLLGFTAGGVLLFALAYWLLSRSFLRIVTRNTGVKKAVYREKAAQVRSASAALFAKEGKRFLSCPIYLLNSGLPLILLPAGTVFLAIRFSSGFPEELFLALPWLKPALGVFSACIVALIASMGEISAPSVSLEGKTLWILQSLPVEPKVVLRAKQKLHTVLLAPLSGICAAVLGYVLTKDLPTALAGGAFCAASTFFLAAFGVFCDLRHPNLVWTNESVPVKQGLSVLFGMLAGLIIAALTGLGAFLMREILLPAWYLLGAALILTAAAVAVRRWLDRKGAALFTKL